MGSETIRDENVSVNIDTTELDDRIADALGSAAKTVKKRMETELKKLLEEALLDWPIKTGKSKASLFIKASVSGKGIDVTIGTKGVDYVYYIKADDLGGKNPWRELILKPARKLEKILAEELESELLELLGE